MNKGKENIFSFTLAIIFLYIINISFITAAQVSESEEHNNKGCELINQGKFNDAIEELEKAIKINPFFQEAYNNMGVAFIKKEEYKKAIPYLKKALELDEEYGFARFNLAIALHNLGKVDEAIAQLKKTVEINPKFFKAYYNLACYYSLNGEIEIAIDNLQKAIEVGYSNLEWIEKDSDLDNIRDHPKYKEIIENLEKRLTNIPKQH